MPDTFAQLPRTSPLTEPAQEERTFNQWWLDTLVFRGGADPVADKSSVVMALLPYSKENGKTPLVKTAPTTTVTLRLNQVLTLAATRAAAGKPKLLAAVNALLEAAVEIGVEQGKL